MHASSYENMQLCYERYVQGAFMDDREEISVLDIGAMNVNGSYKTIFSDPKFNYVGADMAEGAGVDLLLRDPYKLPLADESVDVVLSGQMFEHCEFFWLAFAEMCRVVKRDGYIFLIAPSSGEIHRFPVDCYRFYPDAFLALGKYANCHVVDVWMDERLPWRDLVGVFRRTFPLGSRSSPGAPVQRSAAPGALEASEPLEMPFHVDASRPLTPAPPEFECVSGGLHYIEFLRSVHAAFEPRGYLEIGVRGGHSLELAACAAIGIDPAPDLKRSLGANAIVVTSTSDAYFRANRAGAGFPIDLAFIDGMHAFEYALRDFINIERLSHPGTLIAIDDVFPNHPAQALRTRKTKTWTGDVWKLIPCLRKHRPDLTLLLVDTSPSGMLMIAGLDHANTSLWRDYNAIVKPYIVSQPLKTPGKVPPEIIARQGAMLPSDPRVNAMLSLLKDSRNSDTTVVGVNASLARWRSDAHPPETGRV